MNRRSPLLGLAALAALAFLYAPLVTIITHSFNAARFGLDWQGTTSHWYARLLDDPHTHVAALNTLELACTSTFFSVLIGSALAYGLSRYHFPGKPLFHHVLHVPVFLPDIVLAVALLLFFAAVRQVLAGFELGQTTLTIAHVTF